MLLTELKKVLSDSPDLALRIKLYDGASVPEYFHITEAGQATKTFIDCGGKVRVVTACVLQAWPGSDVEHRLSTKKLAKILKLGESIIPTDAIPVEVEYDRGVLSQYPVTGLAVTDEAITLELGTKHTACLAKDSCGSPAPASSAIPIAVKAGCC